MIIWVVAFVLMGLLGWVGFFRGGIRVAISLVGILFGLLFAAKVGPLFQPLVVKLGVQSPFLAPLIGPVALFLIISIAAKIAAAGVHQKVFVWYQYKALDVHRLLWERLNSRLGLCLGLLNGALYFFILMIPFQPTGYLLAQMQIRPEDPPALRYVTMISRQLEQTGLNRGLAAWDPLPEYYYDLSDVLGLVRNNPLLEARLGRYPVFLSFAERPEFQAIASDPQFTEMRQTGAPLIEILRHEKVQAIINNRDLIDELKRAFAADARDLRQYMETGRSEKYGDEKILGRWNFDVPRALTYIREARPNITSTELKRQTMALRLNQGFWKLVCTTDNKAILKGADPSSPLQAALPGVPVTVRLRNLFNGTWRFAGGQYIISLQGGSDEVPAVIEGSRLTFTREGMTLVFLKEE